MATLRTRCRAEGCENGRIWVSGDPRGDDWTDKECAECGGDGEVDAVCGCCGDEVATVMLHDGKYPADYVGAKCDAVATSDIC